jgi:Flp pilus assembly protein TadG
MNRPKTHRERGQVLVIFSIAIFLFMGLCAIALDVSWYWVNGLRMQRAADAAALAGVVHLPSDPTTAISVALDEAEKNGYTDGVGGVSVVPTQDTTNPRRLRVAIAGPVGTYFARVFGFDQFPSAKDSKAEYVLPVPMGSPDPYYGIFGTLRHPGGGVTTTTTSTSSAWTAWTLPTTSPSGNWTNPARAYTYQNAQYATRNTNTNPYHAWSGFGVVIPGGSTVINGIEVEVRALSTDPTGCELGVALTWSGANVTGANWTASKTQTLTGAAVTSVLGGSADNWGRAWTAAETSNANFRVRVQYVDPGANCTNASTASLDHIRVRFYTTTTTTTSVFTPDSDVAGPAGQVLNPQGFWAVMHGSGSDDINGDKYQPRYAQGSGNSNSDHDIQNYYNYAVELPAGTSGSVYIFDPVFCAVQSDMGTGDRWFGGSTAIWSFYDLYDTQGTLYDQTDDGSPVASSGSLFKTQDPLTDPSMGGPSASGSRVNCESAPGSTGGNAGGAYHNDWYQLPGVISGGASGTVFRLHTTTTDASSPDGNLGANGQNSFGIYVNAPGARIYGMGAMEQYSPLPGGQSSTFYLAQLDSVHAGKTMEIKLWDIGDTNGLSGTLEILEPTSSGWTPATINWSAARGTSNTNAYNCDSLAGTGTVITAATGGTQYFQGCWLTILIPLPTSYSAPQSGWWKIRYNIGGSSSSSGFDLTTWQVQIRGNPVHLVLP